MGIGAAATVIGCMKLTTSWFPFERFGLMTGLLLMFGMLGAISGEAPVALLVAKFDWRVTMLILGIAGIALGRQSHINHELGKNDLGLGKPYKFHRLQSRRG